MYNINENNKPLTTPDWKIHSRKVGMPHTSPRWGSSQSPLHLIKQANNICGFKHYDEPALIPPLEDYKDYEKVLAGASKEMDKEFDKLE